MQGRYDKRHIVILTDCLVDLAGGAERQIYELAKGLDKGRFRLTVASLECGGEAPADVIRETGCDFKAFPVKRIYGLSGISQGFKFFRYLKKEKVDVLMTYHFSSDIWGTLIARLAGVRLVISNRRDIGFWRKGWHVLAYRAVNRLVTRFIVNAGSTKKMMIETERVHAARIDVIPNGIKIEPVTKEGAGRGAKEVNAKKGEQVIMHVANIRPVKGHVHLVRAFARVIPEFSDVKLVLIGEDRMEGQIQKFAKDLGIEEKVQFMGKVTGTRSFLPAADICVLPSDSEGLSNAILEYMAAGKPVIATRVGGNPELVEHGVTGLLVERADERGLKETMLALLRDKNKRETFGKNGLKKARDKFSMEAMVSGYEELFRELMEREDKQLLPREGLRLAERSQADCHIPINTIGTRNDNIKVLHLISSVGLFGAEAVAINICRYFQQNGTRCILGAMISGNPGSRAVVVKAREVGVPVIEFNCAGKFNPVAAWKMIKYIKENNIRLVHTHNYKTDILGCLVARMAGVPVVATAHGFTDMDHKVSAYEAIDRFFLKNFFPRVVVMTDKMLPGISGRKKKVIRNGIDFKSEADEVEINRFKRTYEISDDDIVIGTVGRLSKEKNQILLIKAVFELMRSNPRLKALIVGDGPEKDALQKFVTERNLTHKVIFTGIIKNVGPVYPAMDVFVLPSLTEGVPMTILEAMAAKVPVVATKVGAIPELIENGKNGFLIDSGDKETLKEKISFILKNPKERRAVVERAFHEVKERFSIERMGEEYRKVYREVIK